MTADPDQGNRREDRAHDRRHSRVAIVVGLACALTLAVVGSLVRHEPTPRGDDLIYEKIATHPFATHTYSFAFRIGLPLLVHVLPFSHTASFLLLAWLATGVAGAFAYLLLRHFGTSQRLATLLAIALSVSPPLLIVSIRDGRNTDAASVMILMAATFFAVKRRSLPLGATLLIGATIRESTLFMIPFTYALWARGWWDPRVAARIAALALPAVALFVALHVALPTVGKQQVSGYSGGIVGGRLTVIRNGLKGGTTEFRRVFSIYGPLWISAPLALITMSFARRGLVLILCCVAAMTVALDWGRVMLLAAPVFYPAAGHVLSRHSRWQVATLVTFAFLIIGYAVYMDHSGVRTGIIDQAPPAYPVR